MASAAKKNAFSGLDYQQMPCAGLKLVEAEIFFRFVNVMKNQVFGELVVSADTAPSSERISQPLARALPPKNNLVRSACIWHAEIIAQCLLASHSGSAAACLADAGGFDPLRERQFQPSVA